MVTYAPRRSVTTTLLAVVLLLSHAPQAVAGGRGTVVVACEQAGVTVVIPELYTGPLADFPDKLPVGEYDATLSAPGFISKTVRLAVAKGETTSFVVSLEPVPPPRRMALKPTVLEGKSACNSDGISLKVAQAAQPPMMILPPGSVVDELQQKRSCSLVRVVTSRNAAAEGQESWVYGANLGPIPDGGPPPAPELRTVRATSDAPVCHTFDYGYQSVAGFGHCIGVLETGSTTTVYSEDLAAGSQYLRVDAVTPQGQYITGLIELRRVEPTE